MFPARDFDHHNNKHTIVNLIHHTVRALSNTIALLPGEFLASNRSRIVRQKRNLFEDFGDLGIRDGTQIFRDRLFKFNTSAASITSMPMQTHGMPAGFTRSRTAGYYLSWTKWETSRKKGRYQEHRQIA